MRLHSIRLKNFRQFAGDQTLDLRSDHEKPVSLVFGANGSGKTTLLNAFTWVLYSALSDDVEEQDRLATDSYWQSVAVGDSATVEVELTFDHDGQNYRLLRIAESRKESERQVGWTSSLQLWRTRADGSSEMVGAPQEAIQSILPRGVSRFFFFNGERIENLVKKGAYSEVQQDIKVLLDLEQVERALTHLPKLDRRLTADLKKHGGEKASEIQTAIDDRREQETSHREELKIAASALAVLVSERELVEDALRQHADAAPLQKQRDDVAKQLDQARARKAAAIQERLNAIGTRGFLAFTAQHITKTNELAAALYQKGALPSPLKREFVDHLLETGECICGASLDEHSNARDHVLLWRERAGLQDVETAWQQLSGQIASLDGARAELRDVLQSVAKRIATETEQVGLLEESRTSLDAQLIDSRMEDVQQLETKRLDTERLIGEKQQHIGSLKAKLDGLGKEIEQKTAERSRAEVTDELAKKARARSDLVQAVRGALENILVIRSEDMRRRLDAELKLVFKEITHQNHTPSLSESFELTLHKEVDGNSLPVPKSTGENQILSLSFVAAVSKLAREIREERREIGDDVRDGGVFPIVMDAAFGSLDQDYQLQVARALAKMAPQLIVLVSKSQGLGPVVQELMPYVSHLSVVVTNTSAIENSTDNIELGGTSYPYIRGSESDCSEILVIK